MTRRLRDATIRTKILALIMVVTAIALLLASSALLLWDYYQFRADISRELRAAAQMVLDNSTAAMSFKDQTVASEALGTLAPNRHVQVACLYDETNALFSRASPAGAGVDCPARPPAGDTWFTGGRVHVVVHASVAGSPGGSAYLQSDLSALSDRARLQLFTAALVLTGVLFIALIISSALQRIISQPLVALTETARMVTTQSDYSLRATRESDDETGLLVDAFNNMLGHIEDTERERASLIAREREENQLKDEFLMLLSHELRTPLNAIYGWTQMLLLHTLPEDKLRDALQKIARNAEAQGKLIEDLVDVSRLTTGKFRLEREAVDFVTVTRQAVESLIPSAAARRITLTATFETTTAPMHADPDRLRQVIANLVSNAIKFSEPDSSIAVTVRATDATCELAVHDDGIGIDPAFLPFVFDPFRQADSSSTRSHGGLGLGLSIVRRIVELHGGEIRMESAGRGQGATAIVRLPLDPSAIANVAHPATEPPAVSGTGLTGVTVLAVDDDPDTRELVRTCLSAAGAVVQEAATAAEGLEMATRLRPDILISDITMPDRDGFGFLADVRRTLGPAVPRWTIALTAQATTGDRARILDAGFDRHVAKPFNPSSLIALLVELSGRDDRQVSSAATRVPPHGEAG